MLYEQRRYGVTVKHLNNGRSIKLYAEDLAGNDFISANLYSGASSDYFRPCEMPAEKVLRFLEGAKAA